MTTWKEYWASLGQLQMLSTTRNAMMISWPFQSTLTCQCIEVINNDALKMVIDDMYDKQYSCTWTPHKTPCAFGDLLSHKQMLTKLIDCWGDNIVLVRMKGCATVVGFKHLLGKTLKIVKAETADEDWVDTIIRQVKEKYRLWPEWIYT